MSSAIHLDYSRRPDLFSWCGPIPLSEIRDWLCRAGASAPGDLVAQWATLGGGELFESEELLAPYQMGEEMGRVTEWFRSRGLPAGLSVIHRGAWLSALQAASGCIIAFDMDSLTEVGQYRSLDAWYRRLIRAEYAHRYGLSALPAGYADDAASGLTD